MKSLITLVTLLNAGALWSQVNPPLQCAANVATPPIVRAEGATEYVGDLTVRCTGGTPTPKGQPIPQFQVTAALNTAVTSRLLANGGSEALLLIDDPGGLSNPQTPQLACPSLS